MSQESLNDRGAPGYGVTIQVGSERHAVAAELATLYPVIGPSVHGEIVERADAVFLNIIVAQHPGRGDGGRFLDSLPRDKRIIVTCVLSEVLIGMLQRRGYAYHAASGCWVREASA